MALLACGFIPFLLLSSSTFYGCSSVFLFIHLLKEILVAAVFNCYEQKCCKALHVCINVDISFEISQKYLGAVPLDHMERLCLVLRCFLLATITHGDYAIPFLDRTYVCILYTYPVLTLVYRNCTKYKHVSINIEDCKFCFIFYIPNVICNTCDMLDIYYILVGMYLAMFNG